MQIFIQNPFGNQVSLEVKEDDTVLSVKKKFTHMKGVPPPNQLLTYRGRFLENEKQLSYYKIRRDTYIQSVISGTFEPPGGLCSLEKDGLTKFRKREVEVGEKVSFRNSFKIGPLHVKELNELSNSFVIFQRYKKIVSKKKNTNRIQIINYESKNCEKEIEIEKFLKFNNETILYTSNSFVHLFDIPKLKEISKIPIVSHTSNEHLLIKRTYDSFYILFPGKIFVLSVSQNAVIQQHNFTLDIEIYHAICSQKDNDKIYFVSDCSGLDCVFYYKPSSKNAVNFYYNRVKYGTYSLFLSSYIDKRHNKELIVISDNMSRYFDVFSDSGEFLRTFSCVGSYCLDKGISTQTIFRNRFLVRSSPEINIEVFDLYENKRIHIEKLSDLYIQSVHLVDNILYFSVSSEFDGRGDTAVSSLCQASISDLEEEDHFL